LFSQICHGINLPSEFKNVDGRYYYNEKDRIVYDRKNQSFWISDANSRGILRSRSEVESALNELNEEKYYGDICKEWRLPDLGELESIPIDDENVEIIQKNFNAFWFGPNPPLTGVYSTGYSREDNVSQEMARKHTLNPWRVRIFWYKNQDSSFGVYSTIFYSHPKYDSRSDQFVNREQSQKDPYGKVNIYYPAKAFIMPICDQISNPEKIGNSIR